MSFQDKTLVCADCSKDFIFSAGEQQFFSEKGFTNTPKRCEDCRSKKKAQAGGRRGGGDRPGRGGDRPKFPATCSQCSASFEAPFQPKEGRPILCRDCFEASRGGGRR